MARTLASKCHATHHPLFPVDDPRFQQMRDHREAGFSLDGDRLDEFEEQLSDEYIEAQNACLIRTVVSIAITLYGTQQAVADRIRIHRSCISVAKDHGELGGGPLAALIADPNILSELQTLGLALQNEIGRAAFIAATRVALNRWTGCPLRATDLTDIQYERLCRVVEQCFAGSSQDMPAGLSCEQTQWLELFAYVFAIVEGLGSEIPWAQARSRSFPGVGRRGL